MGEEPRYLNAVPDDADWTPCEFASCGDRRCGLPAWEDAGEDEPRCEFHSRDKPDYLKVALEQAVHAGHDLSGAELEGAVLPGARLGGARLPRANLRHAVLSGAVLTASDLSGATLSRANLTDADLRGARLFGLQDQGAPQPSDLRRADLKGVQLANATISPDVCLQGAKLGPAADQAEAYVIYDECIADPSGFFGPTYAECAQVYRQLKLAYQQSGNYTAAGEWYLAEMRCLRRQMIRDKASLAKRAWWWVMEYVAGYGERPSYVAVWMAGVIVLCAFMQGWLGIEWMKWDAAVQRQVPEGIGGFGPPSWAGFIRFLNALYFSLITFTTTGYGDLHPANGWGRGVASLEALSGVLLTSLLLVCVVRKFSR